MFWFCCNFYDLIMDSTTTYWSAPFLAEWEVLSIKYFESGPGEFKPKALDLALMEIARGSRHSIWPAIEGDSFYAFDDCPDLSHLSRFEVYVEEPVQHTVRCLRLPGFQPDELPDTKIWCSAICDRLKAHWMHCTINNAIAAPDEVVVRRLMRIKEEVMNDQDLRYLRARKLPEIIARAYRANGNYEQYLEAKEELTGDLCYFWTESEMMRCSQWPDPTRQLCRDHAAITDECMQVVEAFVGKNCTSIVALYF